MRMQADAAVFHNNAAATRADAGTGAIRLPAPLALRRRRSRRWPPRRSPRRRDNGEAAAARARLAAPTGVRFRTASCANSHGLDRTNGGAGSPACSTQMPVDNHGNFTGYIPEFVAWATAYTSRWRSGHTHNSPAISPTSAATRRTPRAT